MNMENELKKRLADIYRKKYAEGVIRQNYEGKPSELTPEVLQQEFDIFDNKMKRFKNFAMLINAITDFAVEAHGHSEREVLMHMIARMLNTDNNLLRSAFGSSMLLPQFAKLSDNDKDILSIAGNTLTFKAHIFHCSDTVRDMLNQTDNEICMRRLPFKAVFIDTMLRFEETRFFGMLLMSAHKNKDGKLVLCTDDFCEHKNEEAFMFLAIGQDDRDRELVYNYSGVTEDGLVREARSTKSLKFLAEFACNFLDFLHDPSVKYVKAVNSYGSAHKHLRNLYDSKKIDLEKTYFVKIEDPLRRYVDNYVRMRTMRGYSHRFWVRGHFRTLHADRYAENIGKRLWIAPYIKGQGMLIEKRYDIDKRDAVSDRSGGDS